MSVKAITWVKEQRVGSSNKKLVMLVLADYADEAWSCFPSQELIAHETELGERTVRRILADLEADGWIRRKRRYADGHRLSDRIHINRPNRPVGESTGQPRHVNRPTTTVHTGQALAGEPSVEPSKNQPPLPPRSSGDGSPPAGRPDGGHGVEASRCQGAQSDRERRARIFAACRVIAVRTVNAHRPGVSNPDAYLDGVAGNLVAKYTARANEALAADPGLAPEALAALLEPTARDGPAPDPAARPRPPDVTGTPTVQWDPPPETAKNRIVGAARAALTGQETP